jgi:hypothetical protein
MSPGFQNFFPTLTGTLGYNRIISLLLVAPPYVFMVFYSYGHCYLSDHLGNRFWFLSYPVAISIVGFLIFMFTDDFGPRYFSFFLMNFVFAQNGTIYAWISNAIPRARLHQFHRKLGVDLDPVHVLPELEASLSTRSRCLHRAAGS